MLVPVILSGGRGTRLWPASREARPKPFLTFAHGRSLLQDTLLRAAAMQPQTVLIATNDAYYFQTDEEISAIRAALQGIDVHYLLEPEGRGTAPAILMAARWVRELHGEDALLLVLPSDHVIENEAAFQHAIEHAASLAAGGALVTLGVPPNAPETAFGYIECDDPMDATSVTRFVEKPQRADAERFLASGRYVWNSGIFCFSVKSIEAAFAKHAPEIGVHAEMAWRTCRRPSSLGNAIRFDAAAFAAMPEASLDYAILEKAGNLAVVRAGFDWRDIGSWDSVARLAGEASDPAGNCVRGQALMVNARNNYVQADGRLVAAVGVSNLVIVDTPDALLVGAQGDLQAVGRIAEQLRNDGHEAGLVHRTVHRPWGTYTVIGEGEFHKIKRLQVKPGGALSLQMHRLRSEHWVVVGGTARITCDDRVFDLGRHESTVIPPGCRHRIENHGDEDVVIIETQTGSYLGEDDIIRFEDDYGRTEH